MITGFILVLLAAFFKAVADTLIHHFDTSVFPNTRFWNIYLSNKTPKYLPLTKYKWDGWHVTNSLMIFCFLGLVFVNVSWWWYFVFGLWFNLVFNLFYNKILR